MQKERKIVMISRRYKEELIMRNRYQEGEPMGTRWRTLVSKLKGDDRRRSSWQKVGKGAKKSKVE